MKIVRSRKKNFEYQLQFDDGTKVDFNKSSIRHQDLPFNVKNPKLIQWYMFQTKHGDLNLKRNLHHYKVAMKKWEEKKHYPLYPYNSQVKWVINMNLKFIRKYEK
jgi:hypothetical protein